ncbi:MmgE/PrpD family protein [Bosea sp. BK604]|uniref:MmgE/PrpD family protein n=1 Tax=Bosea sp. BK604 TaxID=2512180 RepID=UPI001048341C|nr:MmgE/PrpD family protein [Bosea sp. BK604]TCR62553.1 2-methylcitrate dehydratase [Bosea sp. BK604]
MDEHQPFARRIAQFALGLGPMAGREDVRETITRSVVDTVACLVGALDAKSVISAREAALAFEAVPADAAVPRASLAGSDGYATIAAASFVNGIAARYLDYNDIYLSKEAMHPSDNIPMVLALAEGLGRSGADALDAIIRGYEVHCRLADTVSTRKGGWDNVILGAIAAAVAASTLLELDEEALANAIAIAATGNVALMETRVGELSMWKSAACSYAGRAGLFAAMQARHGLTGPALALDGKKGLFAQVTGVADPAHFTLPVERPSLFDVHLKAYPIQYFTQTAIDAALAVRGAAPVAEIERIRVETFEFGRVAAADSPQKWQPRTRETADHSLPYAVAAALLDGKVGEAQFEPARILANDIQSLMALIEVEENPDFTAAYPERVPTRITVSARGGDTHEAQVDFPRGHARNPMSHDEISAKFRDMSPFGGETDALLGEWWRLASLPGAAFAALIRKTLIAA